MTLLRSQYPEKWGMVCHSKVCDNGLVFFRVCTLSSWTVMYQKLVLVHTLWGVSHEQEDGHKCMIICTLKCYQGYQIKDNRMGDTCNMYKRNEKCLERFSQKNWMWRDHLENPGTYEGIIWNWIWMKYCVICGLHSSGSVKGPTVTTCAHGNEPSGSTKWWGISETQKY